MQIKKTCPRVTGRLVPCGPRKSSQTERVPKQGCPRRCPRLSARLGAGDHEVMPAALDGIRGRKEKQSGYNLVEIRFQSPFFGNVSHCRPCVQGLHVRRQKRLHAQTGLPGTLARISSAPWSRLPMRKNTASESSNDPVEHRSRSVWALPFGLFLSVSACPGPLFPANAPAELSCPEHQQAWLLLHMVSPAACRKIAGWRSDRRRMCVRRTGTEPCARPEMTEGHAARSSALSPKSPKTCPIPPTPVQNGQANGRTR